MSIAFLASRIRPEEKLLLQAYQARGVDVLRLDERSLSLSVGSPQPQSKSAAEQPIWADVRALHDRSIAFGCSSAAIEALEHRSVTCVNRSEVIRTCGDKLRTGLALSSAGVPQPETRVAFGVPEALRLLDEELGYPAVIKPTVGSWGRLVARLNDRDAAEAVLESRELLGNWTHRTLYLQRLVQKPGRDVRVFVVGDQPIAAIYRQSDHWITNTARGASTSNCRLEGRHSADGPSIGELALQAARAVGGGMLAVDLVEDPERGFLVLEVNHTMEFRNSIDVTGVDIPAAMVNFVLQRASAANSHEPQNTLSVGGAA